MRALLFSVLIFLNTLCLAQTDIKSNKISAGDSLSLLKSMGALVKAVESKDNNVIATSTLETVYCEICLEKISFNHPPEDAFIELDHFTPFLVDWLRTSPAWIDIKQYAPVMSSTTTKGYVPKSVKLKPDEPFTEFELSYNIESLNNKCIFSFVKDDGKFKLWAVRFSTD